MIDTFEYLNTSILDQIRPSNNNELTKSACNTIDEFFYCVKKLSNTKEISVVPVASLFVKCVHVLIKEKSYDLIVTIVEHH